MALRQSTNNTNGNTNGNNHTNTTIVSQELLSAVNEVEREATGHTTVDEDEDVDYSSGSFATDDE